ncbi:hypothetical protein [Azospirillum largimobile]
MGRGHGRISLRGLSFGGRGNDITGGMDDRTGRRLTARPDRAELGQIPSRAATRTGAPGRTFLLRVSLGLVGI